MAKDIKILYGIDTDCVAGWLGSYGGEDSPTDISRGVCAGNVGMPRLLALFEKYGMKTTWFSCGHTIETFPAVLKSVADAGHEIALHGYSHENPLAMTPEQEEKILVKCIDLIVELTGKKPVGYRAPWWEFSKVTNEILDKYGIKYDSSLMAQEFHPYYVTKGDNWYPIRYDQDPETWMKPMEFGGETGLLELPVSWYLDDLPPQMFMKIQGNASGWTSPDVIFRLWKDEFDYLYEYEDEGCFPITIHPDVSGRPQGIMMHTKLIEYMRSKPGVRFMSYGEAYEFYKEHPELITSVVPKK